MTPDTGRARAHPARPERRDPAHSTARRAGLRVSARHLRSTARPSPLDLAHRKIAAGRAITREGVALLAAAAVLFGAALLASHALG